MRAILPMLQKLLSVIKVNGKPAPFPQLLSYLSKLAQKKHQTGHHGANMELEQNPALCAIRSAYWKAIELGDKSEAKTILTLALSCFDGLPNKNSHLRRFFRREQPVNLHDIVIFRADEKERAKPLTQRNWSVNSKVVRRARVTKVYSNRTKVECQYPDLGRKDGKVEVVDKTVDVDMGHVRRADNVYVSEDMIKEARKYKQVLGVGVRPVPTPVVQYAVISTEALSHFMAWIFDSNNTTVLKARGHDKEHGRTHKLNDYISKLWTRYFKDAEEKGIKKPLSRENFRYMCSMPIFKRTSPEECACAQCSEYGWEGISKLSKKLLKELSSLKIWDTVKVDGKKVVASPSSPQGGNLEKRAAKLWDFLRTEYASHLKTHSSTGSHCLQCQLSSRADARLNKPCTHPSPPDATELPEGYNPERRYDIECTECGKKTGSRKTPLFKSAYACLHCSKASCGKCVHKCWSNGEHLGVEEKKGQFFICNECSQKVEGHKHCMDCKECNQVSAFCIDLSNAVTKVEEAQTVPAKTKKRLRVMCGMVMRNIELFQGHAARDKWQSRFWVEKLEYLKDNNIFDEAICLSDFWK